MRFRKVARIGLLTVLASLWAFGLSCESAKALSRTARSSQDTIFNQLDSKGRKHGHWKKVYPNGKVAYQAQFRHDVPLGITIRYNEKGIRIATIEHAGDGKRAKAKIYDDKGALIAEGNYFKQQKDSIWTLYADGRVVARESYSKGEKEGIWELYSDKGLLAERYSWREGKMHGEQEVYYATGKLNTRWEAVDGVDHGPTFSLYPSGVNRIKGQYKDGKKEGLWLFYSPDARTVDSMQYENGLLIHSTVPLNTEEKLREIYQNQGRISDPATGARH